MGQHLRHNRKKRRRPTDQEIVDAWNAIEDDDLSTEMLIQRVCDYFDGRIDAGDVASAIAGLD